MPQTCTVVPSGRPAARPTRARSSPAAAHRRNGGLVPSRVPTRVLWFRVLTECGTELAMTHQLAEACEARRASGCTASIEQVQVRA